MYIQLDTLKLKVVDKNNKEDLEFLDSIFKNANDPDIDFLGHLENYINNNTYIVINSNNERIGYFSMTEPILNINSDYSTSLYYGISKHQRSKGYATSLVSEVSDYIFKQNIANMLVLTIDNKNIKSKKVAEKLDFTIQFQDEEETIYTKHNKTNKKTR